MRYLSPGDPYRSAPDDGIRRRPVLDAESRRIYDRAAYLAWALQDEDRPDGGHFLSALLEKRS